MNAFTSFSMMKASISESPTAVCPERQSELELSSHLSHHIIALWAIGAPGDRLRAAFEKDAKILLPSIDAPEEVTDATFIKHLGDPK